MRNILSAALGLALVVSSSLAMAGYTSTKHPIVLVHGVTGFDTIGGLINYFHRIPYNLERSGAEVHTTSVSFVNSSDERGRQLADYVTWLVNKYSHINKVNLMAHSQGAPTSRVAASRVPSKIASITSVNGVNFGSTVADVIRKVLPPGSYIEGGADAIAEALGGIINELTGSNNPQDGIAALETLTKNGTIALNESLDWKGVNPNGCGGTDVNVKIDGNTVKMYSWGGKTMFTNALDAADAFLILTSKAFKPGENNDGLVSSCSQKMGKVISVNYNLNHVDAINHIFGLHHVFLEPISLYRSQANRLKNAGV